MVDVEVGDDVVDDIAVDDLSVPQPAAAIASTNVATANTGVFVITGIRVGEVASSCGAGSANSLREMR